MSVVNASLWDIFFKLSSCVKHKLRWEVRFKLIFIWYNMELLGFLVIFLTPMCNVACLFFFLVIFAPVWSGILLDDSFLFFQAMIAIIFNLIIASFDWFILEINLWIFFLSPVRKGAKIWKRRMSVWAPHLYCLDIGRIQNLIKADILLKLNSNHLFKSDTYYTYSRSQTSLPCSMYFICMYIPVLSRSVFVRPFTKSVNL